MIALLPVELQQALAEQRGKPVPVMNPATNKLYVLLSQDQYERLRPLLENDPFTLEEQRELLRAAGRRAGWDDAEMDAYDHYDEHRSKQI